MSGPDQPKTYWLLGPDRKPYPSTTPGLFGGHKVSGGYGQLDCPAALRALAKGGYVKSRVFFADEAAARAAGYRPCGVCMREEYGKWKAKQPTKAEPPRI